MGFWTRIRRWSAVLRKEDDLCKRVYDETLKKRKGRVSRLEEALKPWIDGCGSIEVALGDMFKWILENHKDGSLKSREVELLSAGGSPKYMDFSIRVRLRLNGEYLSDLDYVIRYDTKTEEYRMCVPGSPTKATTIDDAIRFCEAYLNKLDSLIELATRYSAARREWLDAREAESIARVEGAKDGLEKLRRM